MTVTAAYNTPPLPGARPIGDLAPSSGPVIVVSNEVFVLHEAWHSLIVVPLSTSRRQRRRGPTVVHIPRASLRLSGDSFAVCHQVTTLDRAKLTEPIGSLPSGLLREIERALKVAMDIP